MENEWDENLPPTQGETPKSSSVLSFIPGFKSMLSPNVRMSSTPPSVNQTSQNRLLEVSSSIPNRSILRDINSILTSFRPGASPKPTNDLNGVGSGGPSTEKESEIVVKSLVDDVVSTVPDKSEAKHRFSGVSEISENSFETAVGGEPVGHLPDLVQSGTSFQSGFGSDTDTSAAYESAGEDERVSPENYRESYTALYYTPLADATQVLDSSAESGSTVTASSFACVDTEGPSDLKNLSVPKRNPALSHLKPDLNLSDLACNFQNLQLQTPAKFKLQDPNPKSENSSVLELSGTTESEWLDSDVEVITHCGGRPSDPFIVYEGKSTPRHAAKLSRGTSGRPSVIEVPPEEDKTEILNVSIGSEIAHSCQTDQDGKVSDCVELTEDPLPEREPDQPKRSFQEEELDQEVDVPSPSSTVEETDSKQEESVVHEADVVNLGDESEVLAEEPCELIKDSVIVEDIASALGEVSLKEASRSDEERLSDEVSSPLSVSTFSTGSVGGTFVASTPACSIPVEVDSVASPAVNIEENVTAADLTPDTAVVEDNVPAVDVQDTSFSGVLAERTEPAAEENPAIVEIESPATRLPSPVPVESALFPVSTVSRKPEIPVDDSSENLNLSVADKTEEVPSPSEAKEEVSHAFPTEEVPAALLTEEAAKHQVSTAEQSNGVFPLVTPEEIAKVVITVEENLVVSPAVLTEDISREQVATVEPPEEILEEVSCAVLSEETAKEQVSTAEPTKGVLPVVTPEKIAKEVVTVGENSIVSPAVITEDVSKEKVALVERSEEISEEVSQVASSEETAKKEVFATEPTKVKVPPVEPEEIAKIDICETDPTEEVAEVEPNEDIAEVSVVASESSQAIPTEEIAKEEVAEGVPTEEIAKEEVAAVEPNKEIAEVSLPVVASQSSQAVPIEEIEKEEVVESLPTEEISEEEVAEVLTAEEIAEEEVAKAVPTEEIAKEEVAEVELNKEIAEVPVVASESSQAVPTEEVAEPVPTETSEEAAPAVTVKEIVEVVAAECAREEVPLSVTSEEIIKEEVNPEETVRVSSEPTVETAKADLKCTVVLTSPKEIRKITEVQSDLNSTTVLTSPSEVLNKTRPQVDCLDETYASADSPLQPVEVAEEIEVLRETPRITELKGKKISAVSSEPSGTPVFVEGVSLSSTPIDNEVREKLNNTINLDDTIDAALLDVTALVSPSNSSGEPNNVTFPEKPLDLSRGSEEPLNLSCTEAALNATRTLTLNSEVSPKYKTPVSSFEQTFDGGYGEPNFNSTFLKPDQNSDKCTNSTFACPKESNATFVRNFSPSNIDKCANSTFVCPKESNATFVRNFSPPNTDKCANSTIVCPKESNATFVCNPSPPKPRVPNTISDRCVFSPLVKTAKVEGLSSLIAVCAQQEKDLREEDDLIHGEKEQSPDFEILSAEAAKVTEEISLSFRGIDQENTVIMADKFDDSANPFATRAKVAVSPPLGRRASQTFNGSQTNITLTQVDSKVNTLDLNVSEAGPDTAGEHFQSEEIFRDPATFDFLSQLGSSSSRRDFAKESLYVKFDPLVGFTSNTTDIPLPSSLTMQPNQSDINPAKEEHPKEPESATVPEPTKNVESAVEEAPQGEPSPPPRTPLRTKTSALATDKLISLSPAVGSSTPVPIKVEPNTVSSTPAQGATTKDTSGRAQVVTQDELIKRLQEHQIVLEEQDKAYQDRIAELQQENEQLNKKVQEKAQGLNQLSLIMKEYEKTISRLVAEKEQEKKAHEEEKESIVKERDSVQGHLNNIEIAFADLHKKYERSKAMIEGFKKNEEVLNAAAAENKANLDKMQSMYDLLKSHAVQKLDTANQELVAIQQRHQQETAKLNAIVKKLEIKSRSLEESLEQKTKENQALAQICDELINSNN